LNGRTSEAARRQATSRRTFLEGAAANWSAQQFTGGAFTAIMPPDVWTNYGPALYKPVGRIYWAGTEVATRWPGYFDGAVSAAQSAVESVLARM
jgi:monoamine oxidase